MTPLATQRRSASQAGMSLVEVLVSLAILAGVLVSVASLFVLGGQRVKGGREMTEGTAIAADILEDMHKLGFSQMSSIFPTCTNAQGCTVTTLADSYASSQWQSHINESLWKGQADITLSPVGGATTPATFTSAEGIRIQVRVRWSEGATQREVVVETLRF